MIIEVILGASRKQSGTQKPRFMGQAIWYAKTPVLWGKQSGTQKPHKKQSGKQNFSQMVRKNPRFMGHAIWYAKTPVLWVSARRVCQVF